MTPRPARRPQWRRTKNGTWTLSLGERGVRVRLFENRQKNGVIYREVQLPGGRKSRCSLGTRDRDRAEELGRQLVGTLMTGNAISTRPAADEVFAPLKLGVLCDRFVAESAMFLDNTDKDQRDGKTRLAIVRSILGDARDVATLCENDVRQYEAKRRRGGVHYGAAQPTRVVRQRTVQGDIKLLKQALRWACSITRPDGSRLLNQNPLQYVRIAGERDVRRPVASFERFEATREAMREFQRRYLDESRALKSRRDRARAERRYRSWVRAEFALTLLEITGKRRSSIAGLQWSDFNFAEDKVVWSPVYDKKRKTWIVRYPSSFFEMVRDFQRRLSAINGFVFPREEDHSQPAPRELISQWIRKAEVAAGLPKLEGGTAHPYRRKWRSERGHHPAKAVALAGGWSDIATMERCYNHPDDADVLAVTSELNKRREGLRQAALAGN